MMTDKERSIERRRENCRVLLREEATQGTIGEVINTMMIVGIDIKIAKRNQKEIKVETVTIVATGTPVAALPRITAIAADPAITSITTTTSTTTTEKKKETTTTIAAEANPLKTEMIHEANQ